MQSIMLAIHPEFAERIIDGTKQFEFRTRIANLPVERIVIYATCPESCVIGEVLVKEVICQHPYDLWQQTCHCAGIQKDRFFNYFRDRDFGYAYSLHTPVKYSEPKRLSDFGLKSAPQSFVYLNQTKSC